LAQDIVIIPDEQSTASIEMVTVSINYRFNIFGFLSLEEIWSGEEDKEKYYGNFGILDAIRAPQWVKENYNHLVMIQTRSQSLDSPVEGRQYTPL